MDCEKFEPLLLDELYEELDELTSAAVKRHVSGCARCATVLNGMRATRRVAALPIVALPEGLEDRILSAAKEAQKVVPIQSPFARAVSWAGRRAMSPQVAMAAVFLLVVGSTAFVIRSRKPEAPQATAVSDWGAPAATIHAPSSTESLDNPAAAAAHGAVAASPTTVPPVATATAMASAFAANEESSGPMDRLTGGAARDKAKDAREDQALAALVQAQQGQKEALAEGAKKGEAKSETRSAAPAAPPPPPMARAGDPSNAAAPAGAPYADYGGQTAPPPAQNAYKPSMPQDGYSAGMAAFRARNYRDATTQFDAAAKSGDLNAALWAAKAVKLGNGGCFPAITRFDAIAQRTPGTQIGNEALYEAADCQIETGQYDVARARLNALLGTSTHRAQAQQALTKLNVAVARRESEKSSGAGGGGAVAAPAKAARPAPRAPAAAKPAAADSLKRESGF